MTIILENKFLRRQNKKKLVSSCLGTCGMQENMVVVMVDFVDHSERSKTSMNVKMATRCSPDVDYMFDTPFLSQLSFHKLYHIYLNTR